MGCIARLGCLCLLVVLAVVAWFTRDEWLPAQYHTRPAVAASPGTWEPLSNAGAQRVDSALARLSQRQGPVFETLSGVDAASYLIRELTNQLPPSADSVEATAEATHVAIRANVSLSDMGGAAVLGPIASMLSDRERVQLTGTLQLVRPGLAEFKIQDLKVHEMNLPHAMIPTLIKRFDRRPRPGGRDSGSTLDDDALPLPLPRSVADIRVANGKITFYKNLN